ncbi:hypothetical protein E2562_002754 [Oryza meyeriana var. granulata]|uniref:Uncharacterized protein n=1 Tax=Oryza meyeriana var. granulata TaxID=110450 RepID=A0A6G1BPR9_9ORYZ|nr:hypothetical protein E2562_002754 [Oryza meyeriana var. granulata]
MDPAILPHKPPKEKKKDPAIEPDSSLRSRPTPPQDRRRPPCARLLHSAAVARPAPDSSPPPLRLQIPCATGQKPPKKKERKKQRRRSPSTPATLCAAAALPRCSTPPPLSGDDPPSSSSSWIRQPFPEPSNPVASSPTSNLSDDEDEGNGWRYLLDGKGWGRRLDPGGPRACAAAVAARHASRPGLCGGGGSGLTRVPTVAQQYLGHVEC